jgi:hypothetical protein
MLPSQKLSRRLHCCLGALSHISEWLRDAPAAPGHAARSQSVHAIPYWTSARPLASRRRPGFMIVSAFGRYLSRTAHDHEMPCLPGAIGRDRGARAAAPRATGQRAAVVTIPRCATEPPRFAEVPPPQLLPRSPMGAKTQVLSAFFPCLRDSRVRAVHGRGRRCPAAVLWHAAAPRADLCYRGRASRCPPARCAMRSRR